ncbi:MAG TPA: glycosyltransferase family 9 protein [Opitutaceae bacterium]|nr:glycosyltransferase family 9 protein [Opitutaceae bacterium]
MRILILKGGALGDFIVTLPALRLLRERWPEAHIELVGNSRAGELGILGGYLNAVHNERDVRWMPLFSQEKLPSPLAEWFEGFDLVINFSPDPDGAMRSHFTHRGTTYVSCDCSRPSTPAAKNYCDALSSLGLRTTDYIARIQLPETVKQEAAQRIGSFHDFVAIHTGSGSSSKNWPAERWAELSLRQHLPVLAITGEAERADSMVNWPEDLFVQRAHHWPLPRLAGALLRARRYLGHDTGITHLAAALGVTTVALFGPTDPAIWAPQGPNVFVIKKGSAMRDISVDDVFFAIAEIREA